MILLNSFLDKFSLIHFNKRESVDINHFNDLKAFIDYSNDMHDA